MTDLPTLQGGQADTGTHPGDAAGRASSSVWATRLWLALWAPVPFVNWLSVLALGRVATVPAALRWLLGIGAGLQLLASMFTPHPLLSLGTAAFRSLLLTGLLLTGWGLGGKQGGERSRELLALLPGLVVVLLTALVYSAQRFGVGGLLHARLLHPSYQMVSIGLAAALTLWLCVFWPGQGGGWRVPLRVLGALTALVVLVLGGSRSPLAAALIGLAVGAVWAWRGGAWRPETSRRAAPLTLGAVALLVMAGVGAYLARPAALSQLGGAHLTQLGLNSRDTYWEEAAGVFRSFPLGGAGVGQVGAYTRSTQDNCFQGSPTYNVGCPAWTLRLSREAWFAPARKLSWMAHNVSLQNLAESGIVGSAGVFLLTGLVLSAAFLSRRPLLIAAVTGYSVVNLVDNSTLIPSLAVSEVFWLIGGVALRAAAEHGPGSLSTLTRRAPLWGGGVLLLSLLPVVLPAWLPPASLRPSVLALNVSRAQAALGPTTVSVGLGHLGSVQSRTAPLRVRLEVCDPRCGAAQVRDIVPDARQEWWGGLDLPRLRRGDTVRIQVLPPENGLLSTRPLGESVWRQP